MYPRGGEAEQSEVLAVRPQRKNVVVQPGGALEEDCLLLASLRSSSKCRSSRWEGGDRES